MKSKIRWGVIGPGSIAHKFAQDIQFTSSEKLTAVASRSEERAIAFAQHYGITFAFSDYQQLIESPEVDAIYIATPHNSHKELSAAALKAGKAVLCEKPITISASECRELMEIQKSTGNYLMEGLWTYFLPSIRKALDWYRDGKIGQLKDMQVSFGHPLPYDPHSRIYAKELAGGVLLDMGIYPIALAYLFYEELPSKIMASGRKAPNGVEDEIHVTSFFSKGVAQWSSSFLNYLPNYAAIIGEKGHILIPDFWEARSAHLYRGNQLQDSFEDTRKGGGFEFQIEAVNQDLLAGRIASEIMPLNSSLQLQQTLESVFSVLELNE